MTKRSDSDTDEPTSPPVAPTAPTPPEAIAPADEPTSPPASPEPKQPVTEEEANRVLFRFLNAGEISGIPPRDLTLHDVERLTPAEYRHLQPPLYQAVSDK